MRIVRNHIYIHWSNNMINRRRNDNAHLIIYKMLIGLVFFFFFHAFDYFFYAWYHTE